MTRGTAARIYLSGPLLLLLALLQVTLMPHLVIAGVEPDLVLAAVVCWAILNGASQGAVWGFLGGLAMDLLSGAPFGMHTFVMTLVGTLAGLGVALLPREHSLLLPSMAVICTVMQQAIYVWLLRAAGWPLEWGQVLLTVVIPVALFNLLLTVLCYPLVGLLHRRTAPEELGW